MMRFDLALFNAIRRFRGANRALDSFGLFLANILPYLMAVGTVVFILQATPVWGGRLELALRIFVALALARLAITGPLALIAKRQRPFVKLGFTPPFVPLTSGSFPSGHTSALFAVSTIVFLADPLWGAAYFALSSLVALGRVFIGVHWPLDIFAGVLIGLGSGYLAHWLFMFI